MSLEGPEPFSEYLWEGYGPFQESPVQICGDCQWLMEVAASAVTLLGALQGVKAVKHFHRDCRDADKQILHVKQQSQQRQLNQIQLSQLSPSKQERIRPAQASFTEVQDVSPLPTDIRKRDRVKWALGRKRQSERILAQHDWVESSVALSLLTSICQDL